MTQASVAGSASCRYVSGVRGKRLRKFFGRSERAFAPGRPRKGRGSSDMKWSKSVANYEQASAALRDATRGHEPPATQGVEAR